MNSAKGNLLTTALVVTALFGMAGCGGDTASSPTATTGTTGSSPTATIQATNTPEGDAWQTYTSEEGRFKVSMPGKPNETTQVAKTAVGDITNYFVKYQEGDNQYAVSYGDYPQEAFGQSAPQEVIEQGFSQTFESSPDKNKVIQKKAITVNGYPGMEGEIEYTSGDYVWYRQILVSNRMYQLIASAKTADKDKSADDARKFHASFELQTPPSGASGSTPTAGGSSSVDSWQTVSSSEGKFSVQMPGQPEETSSNSQTAVGEITQHLFQYSKDGPEYVVAYADYPPETSDADAVKLLEDTIKGAAQGSTVTNQQASTMQGNAAISGEWEGSGVNYTWYKAILVKNRLYQLAVATSLAAKDQNQADAQKFIDSFQLNP